MVVSEFGEKLSCNTNKEIDDVGENEPNCYSSIKIEDEDTKPFHQLTFHVKDESQESTEGTGVTEEENSTFKMDNDDCLNSPHDHHKSTENVTISDGETTEDCSFSCGELDKRDYEIDDVGENEPNCYSSIKIEDEDTKPFHQLTFHVKDESQESTEGTGVTEEENSTFKMDNDDCLNSPHDHHKSTENVTISDGETTEDCSFSCGELDKHEIGQYIAEQTNLYAVQQFNQKTMLGNMKRRSREKDWVPTNKDEMKVLFGLLLLQGIVQKPTMGHFFTRNRLLATPIFYETMPEKRFFLPSFFGQ
ncbi:hypothetical protein C0J52_23414 [Blattella germanica]|nr:hypothetical protein C0J52_23414 [Blattella germanica]